MGLMPSRARAVRRHGDPAPSGWLASGFRVEGAEVYYKLTAR